jgi:hypothetical protein
VTKRHTEDIKGVCKNRKKSTAHFPPSKNLSLALLANEFAIFFCMRRLCDNEAAPSLHLKKFFSLFGSL